MNWYAILAVLIVAIACNPVPASFEECADAGYPIMESYPRKCAVDGKTFVEELAPPEEKPYFVVCNSDLINKVAEDNGWNCVDVCPDGYDSYRTQIGSEMCISHYGAEEISEWNVCEKSTDNCNCVKAVETTSGQGIDNAQFRCVPDQYAGRLLFTSGQEWLDKEGRQSIIIA